MAGCTAPREGHRTASGRANCPVCRYRTGRRTSYTPPRPSYGAAGRATPSAASAGGGGNSRGGGSRTTRAGKSVSYSPSEWRTIEPVTRVAERQAREHPERRDLFLCHAWEDRSECANDLYNLLIANGATVWFSEKDVGLGKSLLREIDRGLISSRIGIVLVTPALLRSLAAEGIADKELSALLATDRVIPVAHGTTFDALRDVSPLLASRSGLDTAESSINDVAAQISAAAAALTTTSL
ncbi:TIR domain-containing protein [Williamsia sterculiae]|uniref:TIR domain-containing protein n=1 Tax=Williamsia sterculiae TaxID=1344003 RepID=A0A1N7HDV9_9NOCA|nr:TIR domain-containing protein [Williamsia sterculiae]